MRCNCLFTTTKNMAHLRSVTLQPWVLLDLHQAWSGTSFPRQHLPNEVLSFWKQTWIENVSKAKKSLLRVYTSYKLTPLNHEDGGQPYIITGRTQFENCKLKGCETRGKKLAGSGGTSIYIYINIYIYILWSSWYKIFAWVAIPRVRVSGWGIKWRSALMFIKLCHSIYTCGLV